MTKMLLMFPALLITSGLLAADGKPVAPAEKAAPAEKKPWTIEATPKVTTVQPGGKLDFTVRVVNSADASASFFVRTQAWYAKSDNPNIVLPEGPNAPPGMNPVLLLNKLAVTEVTLAPKEAYTHDWSSTLAKDSPAGDMTFRVGVPLKLDKSQPDQVFWSEPVKITVQRERRNRPLASPQWKRRRRRPRPKRSLGPSRPRRMSRPCSREASWTSPVRIINTGDTNAKLFFQIQGVWYAKSDNPNIVFFTPPLATRGSRVTSARSHSPPRRHIPMICPAPWPRTRPRVTLPSEWACR